MRMSLLAFQLLMNATIFVQSIAAVKRLLGIKMKINVFLKQQKISLEIVVQQWSAQLNQVNFKHFYI
jgi:hypothetical protein